MKRLFGTVALLMVLLVLLASCGSSSYTGTFDGKDIRDPKGTIAFADKLFHSDAELVGATTTADSRCYFLVRDRKAVQHQLGCGPVLHAGGNASRAWDTYDLRAIPDGSKVRLVIASEATVGVSVNDTLERPDKQQAPIESVALAVPQTGRLPTSYAGTTTSKPDATFEPVNVDVNLGSDGPVKIVERAFPDVVNIRSEHSPLTHKVTAATGERIMVVHLQGGYLTPAFTLQIQNVQAAPTVIANGSRDVWFVASLPAAQADVATLGLSYQGKTQFVDLKNKRLAEPRITDLYSSHVFPANVNVPEQNLTVPFGTIGLRTYLAKYAVTDVTRQAHISARGWADDDKTWWVLHVDGLRSPLTYREPITSGARDQVSSQFDLTASFRLTLPDGNVASPVDLRAEGGEQWVAFAVPDSVTSGVFRITPTWNSIASDGHVTLVYNPVEVVVTDAS